MFWNFFLSFVLLIFFLVFQISIYVTCTFIVCVCVFVCAFVRIKCAIQLLRCVWTIISFAFHLKFMFCQCICMCENESECETHYFLTAWHFYIQHAFRIVFSLHLQVKSLPRIVVSTHRFFPSRSYISNSHSIFAPVKWYFDVYKRMPFVIPQNSVGL